jgi:ribosomal protein S18 acetylase RimI-like enzyme
MESRINNPHDNSKNNQEKLDMSVKFATPEDWDAFRDLRIEALDSDDQKKFTGENPEYGNEERSRTPEEWKELLARKDIFSVLMLAGTKPVGSVEVYENHTQKGVYGISRAYVNKEFRGSSVKKQFAFLLKEVVRRGGTEVVYGVWHENKGILLLSESFGFKKISEQPYKNGFYEMKLTDVQNPQLVQKIDTILNS